MRSKILAGVTGVTDNADLPALCDAIAEAVVEHIKAAGVVNVTVTTVTACGAGAGTGSGTGTGAIT